MTDYIATIQRRLVTDFGMPENPEKPGLPLYAPDGIYPMKIDGKMDHVRIKGGMIECCRFNPPSPTNP